MCYVSLLRVRDYGSLQRLLSVSLSGNKEVVFRSLFSKFKFRVFSLFVCFFLHIAEGRNGFILFPLALVRIERKRTEPKLKYGLPISLSVPITAKPHSTFNFILYILFDNSFKLGQVVWGCRIHRLHFCRWVWFPQLGSRIRYSTLCWRGSNNAGTLRIADYPFIAIGTWSALTQSGRT